MADKKGPKTHEPKSVTPTAAEIARGLRKFKRDVVKGAVHRPLGETEASAPVRCESGAAENVGKSLSALTGGWEMYAEERFTNMETRLQARYDLGLSDLRRELDNAQSLFRTEVWKKVHSAELRTVVWVSGIVLTALVAVFLLLVQFLVPLGERVRELEVETAPGSSVELPMREAAPQPETTPGSP